MQKIDRDISIYTDHKNGLTFSEISDKYAIPRTTAQSIESLYKNIGEPENNLLWQALYETHDKYAEKKMNDNYPIDIYNCVIKKFCDKNKYPERLVINDKGLLMKLYDFFVSIKNFDKETGIKGFKSLIAYMAQFILKEKINLNKPEKKEKVGETKEKQRLLMNGEEDVKRNLEIYKKIREMQNNGIEIVVKDLMIETGVSETTIRKIMRRYKKIGNPDKNDVWMAIYSAFMDGNYIARGTTVPINTYEIVYQKFCLKNKGELSAENEHWLNEFRSFFADAKITTFAKIDTKQYELLYSAQRKIIPSEGNKSKEKGEQKDDQPTKESEPRNTALNFCNFIEKYYEPSEAVMILSSLSAFECDVVKDIGKARYYYKKAVKISEKCKDDKEEILQYRSNLLFSAGMIVENI